jgi:lactoylglutathione lyase
MAEPSLRLEVFPSDLGRFVDFYVRVLRFDLIADRRGTSAPYVSVRRGAVNIGATRAWQTVDASSRAVPAGAELVIEVDDLVAERDALVAADYPLAEDITERPWGLADFRAFDPDGYYIRFTTRDGGV